VETAIAVEGCTAPDWAMGCGEAFWSAMLVVTATEGAAAWEAPEVELVVARLRAALRLEPGALIGD
jgi:hypothetical protein